MTDVIKDSAAGFLAGQSAGAGTLGYNEGISPTLKGTASGTNQVPAVLYENHPNDSRVTEAGELCPTISRRFGIGGGNTPIVGELSMAVQLNGDRDNPGVSVSDVAFSLSANPMSDRGQSVLTKDDAVVEDVSIVGECVAVQLVGDCDNPSIGISDVAYALTANAQSKVQSVLANDKFESATFDWQKGNDVNNPRPSTMNIHKEIASTLNASKTLAVVQGVVGFSCKDHGADASDEISPTLRAMNFDKSHLNGGGQVAIVVKDCYVLDAMNSNSMLSKNPDSGCRKTEVTPTLDTSAASPNRHQGGLIVMDEVIPIHDQATRHIGRNGEKTAGKGNGLGIGKEGDPCPTLTKGDKHAVFISDSADGEQYMNTLRSGGDGGIPSSRGENMVMEVETGQGWWKEDQVAGTLRVEGENRPSRPSNVVLGDDSLDHPKNIYQNQEGRTYESDLSGTLAGQGGSVGQGYKAIRSGMTLRRLMPSECCILQGFPVDWCDYGIDENGKKIKNSDSTIYRMMGNAASVPVCEFIAKNLKKVLTDIDSGRISSNGQASNL